jgi:hypothetical protein
MGRTTWALWPSTAERGARPLQRVVPLETWRPYGFMPPAATHWWGRAPMTGWPTECHLGFCELLLPPEGSLPSAFQPLATAHR